MRRRRWGDGRSWRFILGGVTLLLLLFGGTLALADAGQDDVSPTNTWVDIYSTHSAFDGQPLQPGDYVAVFDPSGVQCGEFVVHTEGYYGLMSCYGDDPDTSVDEGAVAGDVLHFTVNGFEAQTTAITHNATPVPADSDIVWNQHGERWQVDLDATGAVSDLSIAIVDAGVKLSWRDVGGSADHYEVWRSAAPYFAPGDAGSQRIADAIPADPGSTITYADPTSHLGDAGANDYYIVRTIYASGKAAPASSSDGCFDFSLSSP